MEKFSKNDDLQIVVGRNFKSLRSQVGLTKDAMAMALNISISYVLMIERGAANISSTLAKDIGNFFEIEVAQLYSEKPIKLKHYGKIQTVKKFYDENRDNAKFFIHKRKEYSTAAFLREVLIAENVLDEFLTAGEIIAIADTDYNRPLSSQALSRELRRAYLKDDLEREDKFKNGSVYEYRIKRKSSSDKL